MRSEKQQAILLFPEIVLRELQRHLGSLASTYILETTPHRSQRMLVFGEKREPVAVCKWASGAQVQALRTATQICQGLAAEHASLRSLLPSVFFAKMIGVRYVVARPWLLGTPLLAFLDDATGREAVLMDAVNALIAVHNATCKLHTLDENDYRTCVTEPISWLQRLPAWNETDRDRLRFLATGLRRLIGQRLPFGIVHGDFEFGNLLLGRDGSIRVLDWDIAMPFGLCMVDLVHLLVAYGVNAFDLPYAEGASSAFCRDGQLYDLSQRCVDVYRTAIPFPSELLTLISALAFLQDASSYVRRLPFLTDTALWSSYIAAAEQVLAGG